MKLQVTDSVVTACDLAVNGSFVPSGTEGVIIRAPTNRIPFAVVEFEKEGRSIVGEVPAGSLKRVAHQSTPFQHGLARWLKELNERADRIRRRR